MAQSDDSDEETASPCGTHSQVRYRQKRKNDIFSHIQNTYLYTLHSIYSIYNITPTHMKTKANFILLYI